MMITVHEGHITAEAEVDALNWAAKWNLRFTKNSAMIRLYLFGR